MKQIIVLMALAMLIAACQTTVSGNPRVRVQTDDYQLTVGPDGGPRHCPPGHAMKGWC